MTPALKSSFTAPLATLLTLLLSLVSTAARADYTPPQTYLRWTSQIHLHADGSHTKIKERHLRIDTEPGIEVAGEQRQSYVSSLQTLEVLEAWSQSPDGKRHTVTPDKIKTLEESNDGTAEFSDGKVNVIIFPALQVGSEIYVKYRIHQHTPFFPGHFTESLIASPHYPFLDMSLDLVHDAGVSLQWQSRGFQGGPVPTLPSDPPGATRYRYTFKQPQFVKQEAGELAAVDFASALFVTTFKDYADLASTYRAAIAGKATPTPAIRQLALELTAKANTERDKVRALYNWVSRQIRYVYIAVGSGGYVPHDAQSILDHRYGDCKDHVVILEALLRSVGIESTMVLVNSGKSYRLPQVGHLAAFNHAITYVPSLNLFLDSTARFAPMGSLPEEIEDKPVLLINHPAKAALARTPGPNPREDITLTRSWMQVTSDGTVIGSSLVTSGGSTQVVSRSAHFDYRQRAMAKVVNHLLAQNGESGTGHIQTPDPLDLDAPWRVDATFELDPVVNVPGPSAMTIPVGLGPADLHDLKTNRTQEGRTLEYICSSAASYRDEVELRLPPKVRVQRIPPNVAVKANSMSYTAHYRLKGQVVHVVRELKVDRGRSICNVQDDHEWSKVRTVLQRDLRAQVFFK